MPAITNKMIRQTPSPASSPGTSSPSFPNISIAYNRYIAVMPTTEGIRNTVPAWLFTSRSRNCFMEKQETSAAPLFGSLPKTSKTDAANHGFGLRSIQTIIKKYEGTMELKQEDGWFLFFCYMPEYTARRSDSACMTNKIDALQTKR